MFTNYYDSTTRYELDLIEVNRIEDNNLNCFGYKNNNNPSVVCGSNEVNLKIPSVRQYIRFPQKNILACYQNWNG